MSTIIEELRGLAQKIPNLKQLVEEATKPEEKQLAETAWIFNGYDDVVLKYAGQSYELKYNAVTEIKARPQHREIDQFASKDGYIKFVQLPLPGELIARELIDSRGRQDIGFVVWTESNIPDKVKEEALKRGDDYWRNRIETYKIGRDRAKSGQAGKMRPDPRVYNKMKEYAPDDEIFARQDRQTVAQTTMAEAVKQLAAGQQVIVQLQERIVRLEAEREAGSTIKVPSKKPLETDEQYKARIAHWKQEKGLD